MAEPAVVRAAGGVLWRTAGDAVQVALVHRPKYDDWSLPKGKLDPGEPPVVGAVREVAEETGFTAVPERTLGSSRYRVLEKGRDAEKVVQWWAMRATAGAFTPGPEVDALRWLSVPAALARVSSGYDCAPLSAFATAPRRTTTVLLVRHASAGNRGSWAGDDAERPLDEPGRATARELAALLAVYAPERVLSAPVLRCTSTVHPLAQRLGLPVETVDAAAESAGSAAALVDLLRELAVAEQPAVVCSQGGVLPAAVERLTGRSELPARKGSVWALSFDRAELVDAAYTATPQD